MATEQTNIHIYNSQKSNQKSKKTFLYQPTIYDSFFTNNNNNATKINNNKNNNTHINNKLSCIQAYSNKNKIQQFKQRHNGSMNMIIKRRLRNILQKYRIINYQL